MPGVPGGPPADNPDEATARELVEVSRDLELLLQRRIDLILRALDEGGSTRRVGFHSGTNEMFVRRVLAKHGSDKLRAKVSARDTSKRERNDYWPFKSKAEYDAFMAGRSKRL